MHHEVYEKSQAYAQDQSRYGAPNAAIIGQAQGSLNAQSAPIRTTATEDLIQRLAGRIQGMAMLKSRLSSLADRITGPQPCEAAGKDGASSPPSNLIQKLSMLEEALQMIESDIRNSVERLEQAV